MFDDIFDLIHNKLPDFSKGQKKIAAYIIEECEKAAFLTAAKLGKTVGVSESTVVRFAMELGYDGYPSMQNAMRKKLIQQTKVSNQQESAAGTFGSENSITDVLRADADRLYQTADIINKDAFSKAVNAILNGKSIFLLGTRFAAPLAEYAQKYLRLIQRNVQLITSSSEKELLEQLLYTEAGDVLIVFGFQSDVSSAVGAEYCHNKGVTVISITDSQLSLVAKFSDHILVSKIGKVSHVESLTAPMGVVNGLLSAVMHEREELVMKQLTCLDKIYKAYYSMEKRVDEQ